jgi:hypothetical protein
MDLGKTGSCPALFDEKLIFSLSVQRTGIFLSLYNVYMPCHTIKIEIWDDSRIWNRSVGKREKLLLRNMKLKRKSNFPMEPEQFSDINFLKIDYYFLDLNRLQIQTIFESEQFSNLNSF